ncbi:DUF3489 domain-containing protein [Yoonia sp.]|uniref:DUF3489 domain-containing protein n=1 Tax=Yoonia sp. TaxID=2212373 RepID=UPI003F4AEB7D
MTKKAQLIKLLGRKSGADIVALSDILGWQLHTTRAAMSGLRKAGYEVIRKEPSDGGPARYRIEAAPAMVKGTPTEATQDGA